MKVFLYRIFCFLGYTFLGYAFGRWTHVYLNVWFGNPTWALHHWIYGIILMVIAIIFRKKKFSIIILWIGFGLFLSDFNDFLKLAFFSADIDGPKHFWSFD